MIKKSYVVLFLVVNIVIIFSTFCMEDNSKDIFEQLDQRGFGSTDNNFMDFLTKSRAGRRFLAQIRASENIKDKATKNIVHECSNRNITFVSNCGHYDDLCVHFVCTQALDKKKEELVQEKSYITDFANGIVVVENCLLTDSALSADTVKVFENTRVHDLYLLKKILENDNEDAVKVADLYYDLPGRFFFTHKNWPPKVYASQVHPTSGYQVVRQALEYRKAHNIDAIDEDGYSEKFSFDVVHKKKLIDGAVDE